MVTSMHDHPIQHVANAALLSTTLVSFLAQWSPIVTWGVGLIALAWYGVLFYDRFLGRGRSHHID